MPRDYVRNRPSSRSSHKPRKSGGVVWLLAGIFIGLIIAGVYYVKNHPMDTHTPQPFSQPTVTKEPPPVESKNSTTTSSVKKPNASNNVSNSKTVTQAATSTHPSNAASQNLQTQFDFYNVLPGKNVTGPSGDEDVSAVKPAAQTPPSSPAAAQTSQNVPQKTQSSTDDGVDAARDSDSDSDSDDSNDNGNNTPTLNAAQPKPQAPPPSPPLHESKPKGFVIQVGTFSQFADADKLKAQLVLLGFDVKSTNVTKSGKIFTRVWLGPFHTEDEASSVNEQLKENNISAKVLKSSS